MPTELSEDYLQEAETQRRSWQTAPLFDQIEQRGNQALGTLAEVGQRMSRLASLGSATSSTAATQAVPSWEALNGQPEPAAAPSTSTADTAPSNVMHVPSWSELTGQVASAVRGLASTAPASTSAAPGGSASLAAAPGPAPSAAQGASGVPAALPSLSDTSAPAAPAANDGSPPQALTGSDRQTRIASAVPYAQQAEQRTGVPADVNLAFAVHESGLEDRYGPGNSFHGRHAVGDEPGTPITDWGYDAQGNRVDYPTKLKSYPDPAGSFSDFADLIANSSRYQPALQRYQQTGDKAQLIRDIWAAGYGESKTGPDETVNILQHQTSPALSAPATRSQPASGQPQAMPQASAQPSGTAYRGSYTQQALADAGDPDAWSKCGPVAAFQAAQVLGRPATPQEVERLAVKYGWTPQAGMAGLESEANTLRGMNIAATAVTGAVDWQHVIADVQRGNPVILQLPGHEGHYVTAQAYDPRTGKLDFGSTVGDLRAASHQTQFTPNELVGLGWGVPNGALYLDNPATPAPSVVAGASAPTAGVTPAPAGSPSASAAVAPPAADAPDPLRQQLSAGNAGPANFKQLPSSDQPAADLPYDPRADEQGPHEWRPQYGQPDYALDDQGRPFAGAPTIGSWPGDDQNPTLPNYGQQPAPRPYVPDRTDPSQQPQAIPRTNGMEMVPPDAMYRQNTTPQPGTSAPIQNADGSVTTERSITVTEPGLNGGRATNIPTVWDGQIVSDDEAVDSAIRSGIAFPAFGSIDEAVRAAEQRSRDLGAGQATSIGGATVPPEVQNALPNRNRPVRGGPIDETGGLQYRQPLGASNMGPDTATGSDQQPADPDQGPHEATPGSVGAGPVGPLYGPPETSDPPEIRQRSNDQAAPSSPSAPSGFPGLQAVYDTAGNFLHWIQGAAADIGNTVATEGIATPVGRGIANTVTRPLLGKPPLPDTGQPETSIDQAIVDTGRSLGSDVQAIQSGNVGQAALGAVGLVGDLAPSTTLARQLNSMLPPIDMATYSPQTGEWGSLGTAGVGDVVMTAALLHDLPNLARLGYGAVQAGGRVWSKVLEAARAGVPAEQFSQWLNSAADTIDRGIGGAGSALDANAARVAAGDAPFTRTQGATDAWREFSESLDSDAQRAAREAARQPQPRAENDQLIREAYGKPWEETPNPPATQEMVDESGRIARPRQQVNPADMQNTLPTDSYTPSMSGRQNAVPAGWDMIDAGPGLAERAARFTLPSRAVAGRAIGATAAAAAGAASAPDDATWDERTARAMAGGSLGFMLGGPSAVEGTLGAARLIDSLIASGKLNPEILLDHPKPVTRIKALLGLAAEGLPDDARVSVPGMAQFIARLHPDQAAELGPLLSGQATAGEVRQVVQQSLGQRFGQAVSELVSDAVTGMGARGQRAAETRADTATVRGLPSSLQGMQDTRPQSALTSVPTAFGRATETTDPAITGMVGRVADRLGLASPRVFVSPSPEVNAAVMSGPRVKPIIVLTRGLGDADLTPVEMEALLTHELSHAAENTAGSTSAGTARAFDTSPSYHPPTAAEIAAAEAQGARRGEMLNRPVTAPRSSVPAAVRGATATTDDRAGLRWSEDVLSDAAGKPRMSENDPARPSTRSRVNAGSVANERIANDLEPAVMDAGRAGLQSDLPRYLEDMHHRDILNDFYNRGHQDVMDARQPAIDAAKANGVAPAVIQRMEAKAAADADAAGVARMRQRQGSNPEHTFEATDARLQEQEQRLKADGRWGQLQDSAQAIWDHNAETRQRLATAGELDPAAAADFAQRYPHYVPTVPISHLTEGGGGVGSAATLVSRGTTPVVKALDDVGTAGERLNPIVATRNATIRAEKAIQKNAIAQAFAQMMDDATAVNPSATATNPATHRTFLGGGVNISYFENGKPVTMSVPKPIADGIMAATNMGADANGVAATLKRVTRIVTSTQTAARPSFIAVNLARDAGDYATRTMAREGNNPAKLPAIMATWADEAGQAALDVLRAQANGRGAAGAAIGAAAGAAQGDDQTTIKDRLLHAGEGAVAGSVLLGANRVGTTGRAAEFLARGGGEGGVQGSLSAGQRWYRDVLRDGGAPIQSAGDAMRYLGDWAHDVMTLQGVKGINERTETISRTAAMRRAESGGAGAIEAMIAGRDASVDFDRAGTVTRAWNGYIPFLNATVQGAAQFTRMMRKNPVGTTAAITATLAPVMLATEYYNRSDPARAQAYDDVPQYIKDSGLVLMMPMSGSDNRGSRPNYLWLPTEALSPFVVAGRAAMQHADSVVPGMQPSAGRSDANPNSVAPQALGALNEALSIFYPVKGDSAASIGSTFVPPIAKQAIELSQNKDMFRGSTISSPSQDERASGLGHTLAHGANWLGQQTGNQTLQNVTPSQVDYLGRQLPAYGDITSGASDMVKPSPYKQAEEGRIANEPFVGGLVSRFVRDTGGANLERAQGQAATPGVQETLQDANMHPSEVSLEVGASYKNASLTRDEQLRWQEAANAEYARLVPQARRDDKWRNPATRGEAVKTAVSAAQQAAADRVLRNLTPAVIQQRQRVEAARQREVAGAR